MDDTVISFRPPQLDAIWSATVASGFAMASDDKTGALLRMIAASRRSARILELGTGTGLSAAWLLSGMDAESKLDSVDNDPSASAIAQSHLGSDPRLTLHIVDGAVFLASLEPGSYDFVFADAWPGKYTDLELTIASLKIGGILVVDDMLPQPNWTEDHGQRANGLTALLTTRPDLCAVSLAWSTGLIVASKIA